MANGSEINERKLGSDFGMKRKVTVKFNTSSYYNLLDPVTLISGETLIEPTALERMHCELAGWYVDRDLKKQFDFKIPIVEDMVLYAKWKYVAPMHLVSFCSYDETTDVMAEHGQPVKRPRDPVRRGYTFGGWYLADVPDEEYYYLFDTPVIDNMIMWANWIEQERPKDPIGPIGPIRPL